MNAKDQEMLAQLVLNYPTIHVLDELQKAIENQIDELVDSNAGHPESGMVKEMSLIVHHLSILPRR